MPDVWNSFNNKNMNGIRWKMLLMNSISWLHTFVVLRDRLKTTFCHILTNMYFGNETPIYRQTSLNVIA